MSDHSDLAPSPPLPCIGCWGSPQPAIQARANRWVVRCASCGRRTHERLTIDEAVADWNKGLVAVSEDVGEGDVEF